MSSILNAMLIALMQTRDVALDPMKMLGPYLLGGLFFCIIAAQLLWRYWRSEAMKALAKKRGLEWKYDELPSGFPKELLADLGGFFNWGGYSRTYDLVTGYEGGDRLVALDIRVGYGRSSYRQTVVAVRAGSPRGVPLWGGQDLYREKDGWRVVIPKKMFLVSGVLSAKSIEELWAALR